jgi:tRNA(fMet)-specific endonuclease VapC
MDKALVDSDILSEVAKGMNPSVTARANLYLDQRQVLTFTSISLYEVIYGLLAKGATVQSAKMVLLLSSHDEIVPESQDYRLAAEIRAALHIGGTPIGTADPVIAACGIRRNLTLVTGNTRHYQYVIDAGFTMKLDNWRE